MQYSFPSFYLRMTFFANNYNNHDFSYSARNTKPFWPCSVTGITSILLFMPCRVIAIVISVINI